MKKLENYQIIIIGAGLSGLTLAKEICARSNYKILILEKKKSSYMIKIGVFGINQLIHLPIILIMHGKKFQLVLTIKKRFFLIKK
tara:strand:- start:118 stop:372 length:255 start_codon:yes stop_codon:yes gene_type:complete